MNSSDQTVSRILRVLSDDLGANVTDHDLRAATRLDEVVALDSLGTLKFALGLEREFGNAMLHDSLDRELLLDIWRLADYLEQRSAD